MIRFCLVCATVCSLALGMPQDVSGVAKKSPKQGQFQPYNPNEIDHPTTPVSFLPKPKNELQSQGKAEAGIQNDGGNTKWETSGKKPVWKNEQEDEVQETANRPSKKGGKGFQTPNENEVQVSILPILF